MPDFKELSADELKEKMDSDEDFVLVDTLGENSYQRAHLPSAEVVSAHDSKEEFVSSVEDLVSDKSEEVVVYCASHSCGLSPKAAKWLTDEGFENVYDFSGGLKEWAKSGYSFKGEEAEEMAKNLRES